MTLRAATTTDVPALSALAQRTFVQTFVEELGVPYPAADLAAHLEKAYGLNATRALLDDAALRLRVVEVDGVLAGYALSGSCQLPHPDARASHGELRRLYVAHEFHGLGHGRELLQDALTWLEASFVGPLWIGVWSGNLKAQTIYQRQGFGKVGEYDYPVGTWMDHEFILRRDRA